MKKILLVLIILLAGLNTVEAEDTNINLTIRSGNTIIFSGNIPLAPAGSIELNGHTLAANSVLAILNDADLANDDWNISDLQYYDSFGSFYLKCITSSVGNDCDNWQYVVENIYPGISIDQKILSGGENIYLYFGSQYKITLSSKNITTTDTLTVTTEEYDYENNGWKIRNGITAGLTQLNPNDPFSPLEILTSPINDNGQATFSAIVEGSYNVGIKEDFYFPTQSLTVSKILTPESSIGSGRSSGGDSVLDIETKIKFDLKKASEFLLSQQKENGSFGENLYTDWTSLALAPGNYQSQVLKLNKYFQESKMENTLLTDYGRRSMALMALGLNPHNINGENYVEKIVKSFDGTQFGNINEDNDDIFALIVLQNAGYTIKDKIISKDIDFILKTQNNNGSWNNSPDMTGAGIEALSIFNQDETIKKTLDKAKDYLKQNQNDNGGWNNSASSTAWGLQGVLALGEKIEDWKKNENTPIDYLATLQDIDGGIKNENLNNKIWETAYVTSVLSGKTWNQIMQKFEKREIEENQKEDIAPDNKVSVKKKVYPKNNLAQLNINKLASQNTANVVDTLPTPTNTPKNWFIRLLESIFGF